MSMYSQMWNNLMQQGLAGAGGGTGATGAGAGDMTQQNLAALIASQQQPSNLGLPTALPMSGGQTDYRAMLAQLQQGQAQGQMPAYPGMEGMRFAPGAGMLPNPPPAALPEQSQLKQPWTPPPVTGSPSPNLGLGGGGGGSPYDQQFNYAQIALR